MEVESEGKNGASERNIGPNGGGRVRRETEELPRIAVGTRDFVLCPGVVWRAKSVGNLLCSENFVVFEPALVGIVIEVLCKPGKVGPCEEERMGERVGE